MNRNFKLSSEIVVFSEGKHFDLHNDYLFQGFSYDVINRVFMLKWALAADGSSHLALILNDVSWVRVKGMDPDMPFAENHCLDFMGYLHPDDDQIMDGFLHEDDSSNDHHLIFCFNGGLAIRIFAAEAKFFQNY